jgi:molybdenum cofactor cytidylyltransferase
MRTRAASLWAAIGLSYSAAMRRIRGHDRALWSVLLAAGASRRLGEPKQLLRRQGRPLLLRTVEAATRITGSRVVVVLGAHAGRLRCILARQRLGVHVIYNPDWESGMASSIQCGIAALPVTARAALLLLSDQPRVGTRSLRRLARVWRRRPALAVAARYLGMTGAPAILPRSYFKSVRDLRGDVGARALLRSRGAAAVTVSVDMPEAGFDIDTPADRARL